MRALKHQGGMASGTEREGAEDSAAQGDELNVLLEESRRPGGLTSTLHHLQAVARAVRDRISNDTWRVVNSLHEDAAWPEHAEGVNLGEIIQRLNGMVSTLASFGGLASESMTRGQVWLFMDMGRRLERTIYMAGLLRSTLVTPVKEDSTLLEAVLEVGDSFMTYRRRYLANLQLAPVLDLLLADETNPRSVVFQYVALHEHVENLPRDHSQAQLNPEQRVAMGGLTMVRLSNIEELCQTDEKGKRGNLARLLTRVDEDMSALSDIMRRLYLSHAQTSRQLASF